MGLERDIVADMVVGSAVDRLRIVEVAAKAVGCTLAAPHTATVFVRTDFVDRIVDKKAEASDSRGVGTPPCILDLSPRNLAWRSWMDKAADSLVAGNDSPPWLTIMLWSRRK